jgi:hypothetical protein
MDNEERERIFEQHQKIRDWIENVKRATHPHFLGVRLANQGIALEEW